MALVGARGSSLGCFKGVVCLIDLGVSLLIQPHSLFVVLLFMYYLFYYLLDDVFIHKFSYVCFHFAFIRLSIHVFT